ncbi:MAG: VanZ family protein [Patescibacteria group bacterium]
MKYFISWAPALVWMGVIFLLSTRQHVTVSDEYIWNFLFFKTLHVIEYGILFVLYVRAINLTIVIQPMHFFIAFLLTFLYAASDEFHQMFVPTRQGTIRDVIIDGIGAVSLWIFLYTFVPKAPKKLKKLVQRLGLPILKR